MLDANSLCSRLNDAAFRKQRNLPDHRIETGSPYLKDPGWKERLRAGQWWASENIHSLSRYIAFMVPKEKQSTNPQEVNAKYAKTHLEFLTLHMLLVSIGGYETCFPSIEEDMGIILERGRFYPGRSKMMVGRPSQCHSNTAELWRINRESHDVRICTGYALSDDGLWRQHSWLVHRYWTGKQHRTRIVETTTKRLAYFGVELNDDESLEFVENNP